MSERDDGGQAFPKLEREWDDHDRRYDYRMDEGMTLRDYFAAKAMQGIVSVLHQGIRPVDIDKLAHDSFAVADAMLRERAK